MNDTLTTATAFLPISPATGNTEWLALPSQIPWATLTLHSSVPKVIPENKTDNNWAVLQQMLHETLMEVLHDVRLEEQLFISIRPSEPSPCTFRTDLLTQPSIRISACISMLASLRKILPGAGDILDDSYIINTTLKSVTPPQHQPFQRHIGWACLRQSPTLAATTPVESPVFLPTHNLPFGLLCLEYTPSPKADNDNRHNSPRAETIRMVRASRSISLLIDGYPQGLRDVFSHASRASEMLTHTPGGYPLQQSIESLDNGWLEPTNWKGVFVLPPENEQPKERLTEIIRSVLNAHSMSYRIYYFSHHRQ